MPLPRTDEFDEQARTLGLRHTCEDCGYFDARLERCRHEWPTTVHRRARYALPPAPGDALHFCKEFEVL